jgi:hypothetical protein
MSNQIKYHKKLTLKKKVRIIFVIFSVLLFTVFLLYISKPITNLVATGYSNYNDNPDYALVQKDKFLEYRISFETMKNEILKSENKLDGWIISINLFQTGGKVEVWKYKNGEYYKNKKFTNLFNGNKVFMKKVTDLFDKMGTEYVNTGPLKGEEYGTDSSVDELYIYNDAIFFSSGLEDTSATNYIAYTIDGNPPTHGIQPGEELHIKEYAPHWFSVVEGEPRY